MNILFDLKVKMTNVFTKDTISQSQPNKVIQDLKSDGTFMVTFNTNDFIRLLFPLPNKNLSKGHSYDIPMILPYNINGSVINSKGFNSLQFTNYEVINGHKCAVLIGDINISELDLPKNFEGNYELSQIGKGTYYFDIENGWNFGNLKACYLLCCHPSGPYMPFYMCTTAHTVD